MRWTFSTVAVIAGLWIAYAAWPFFTLYGLANAVQSRDSAAVARYVNFPAVRRSLTEQIAFTYLGLTGRDGRPEQPSRGIAVAAITSIADPIVARLISAEALMVLLERGWPTSVLPDRTTSFEGLSSGSASVGNVWQVFVHSDQGLRHFEIGVPTGQPPQRQFKLQFRLIAWSWRLSAIELPEEIRIRLARELIRQIERR